MSKYRRSAKVDENQPGIVKELRKIKGVTVEVGHDDILVGYKGKTYWYEVKMPDTVNIKTGKVRASELKQSQKDLLSWWCGHYKVIWDINQILIDIGIKSFDEKS